MILKGKKQTVNNFDEMLLDLEKEKDKKKVNMINKMYSDNSDEIDLLISAKMIFLDEYCRKRIRSESEFGDIKKLDFYRVREEGRKWWSQMTDEKKAKYEMQVNMNKDFFGKITHINPNRINAYNLFISSTLAEAREEKRPKTLVEVAGEWKKLPGEVKNVYSAYADVLRDERSKLQINFNFARDQVKKRKISLPWGPFKYYALEKINTFEQSDINISEDEIISIAAEEWNQLSLEEKEKYFQIADRERHDYVVKKLEFVTQIKNKNKKPRTAFNLFTNDIEKKLTREDFRNGEFFDIVFEKWNALEEEVKRKYEEREEEEKMEFIEHAESEYKRYRERKPTPYAKFVSKKSERVKKEHPEADKKEILEYLSTEWSQMSSDEKGKYAFDEKLDEKFNSNSNLYNKKKIARNVPDFEFKNKKKGKPTIKLKNVY